MRAGGDHQRRVGVAEVVEAEAGQLRAADGRAEDAVAEVVVVQDRALRRGEGEARLVRLARERLATRFWLKKPNACLFGVAVSPTTNASK